MVSFSCEACNETLAKKKLDAHLNRCRQAAFTCLDCNHTFTGTSYRDHTSCISEAQKYERTVYRGEKKKGKGNQNQQNGQKAVINGAAKDVEPEPEAEVAVAVVAEIEEPVTTDEAVVKEDVEEEESSKKKKDKKDKKSKKEKKEKKEKKKKQDEEQEEAEEDAAEADSSKEVNGVENSEEIVKEEDEGRKKKKKSKKDKSKKEDSIVANGDGEATVAEEAAPADVETSEKKEKKKSKKDKKEKKDKKDKRKETSPALNLDDIIMEDTTPTTNGTSSKESKKRKRDEDVPDTTEVPASEQANDMGADFISFGDLDDEEGEKKSKLQERKRPKTEKEIQREAKFKKNRDSYTNAYKLLKKNLEDRYSDPKTIEPTKSSFKNGTSKGSALANVKCVVRDIMKDPVVKELGPRAQKTLKHKLRKDERKQRLLASNKKKKVAKADKKSPKVIKDKLDKLEQKMEKDKRKRENIQKRLEVAAEAKSQPAAEE